MTLGKKLHQLRRARNLSQEELAAQVNVSRQAVSKWELDEALPDINKIVLLSKLFAVSTDYLLNDDYDTSTGVLTSDVDKGPQQQGDQLSTLAAVSTGFMVIGLLISVASWLRLLTFSPNNIMFVLRQSVLPVGIGTFVQVVGVVVFEVLYSRCARNASNQAARRGFYTMSTWLGLPFPLIYTANVLLSLYRRPITFFKDLTYLSFVYAAICLVITIAIKSRTKTRARFKDLSD